MFSKSDLNEMRSLSDENLPDVLRVYRPASDAGTRPGGYKDTTPPVLESVTRCRVSPFGSTPREEIIGARIVNPDRTWLIVVSVDTPLPGPTRILKVESAEGWVKDLKVISVYGAHTNEIMHRILGEEL